jgi:hypothetical protein
MSPAAIFLVLLSTATGQLTCQAPTSQCIRGGGSDTLKTFSSTDPESTSPGACCAACRPVKGCVASQLVSRYTGDAPSCWLMAVQTYKNPTPGETCNSSLVSPPPPSPPPQRFNRTSFSGVWLQHGDYTDPAMFNASFLVGTDLPIYWSDIEPADGVFDFSLMDQTFAAAAAAGLYIETALSLGSGGGGTLDKTSGVPPWIYSRKGGNESVPQVLVESSQGKGRLTFPWYLDATYQHLFLRVVQAFAAHIATYPPTIRSRIVASQAMFGSTGDDTPWHGTPVDLKYNITREQWFNFSAYNQSTGFAPTFCALYGGIGLPVLWNPGDDCTLCINHLAAHCPGSLFKSGMESHGIFINFEADDLESIHGPICTMEGTHCRGEDWPFETQGNWLSAPAWHMYAHLLEMLTFALDMPGLSEPSLSNPQWAWAYDLFNKYAGSTRPPYSAWVGGIVSLRDGLDCANTDRFPEATYGAASIDNRARFEAITAAFAHRGATLGDPAAAMCASPICSRRANAMNDVGWRVLEGNFGSGGITQVSPNTTSIGHWQVGSKADAYGRYARGFERASGRTEMAFVLEPRMFGGLPIAPAAAPLRLELRVVYYDAFGGAFNVSYDAGAGGCRHAAVAVGASGGWRSTTIPLLASQGYFGRKCGGAGGADIALTSTSDADSIISSVEIYKV